MDKTVTDNGVSQMIGCSKGKDMNYEQAFRNMAKSLTGKEIDPADVGKAPDSRPNSVAIPSNPITEGFSSGSIAGQSSTRLLDKKDHFPVFTEIQARSSMSRAMQLTEVPVWYSGKLDDLRKEVFTGIAKAHPELVPSLNVNVPASRIVALSDGSTPSETKKSNIDDPADVVKTQVPGVKRPTLTSAELVAACQDDTAREAIAGKIMECIEQDAANVEKAKKLASTLLKKGLTAEQFDGLNTYLQHDLLRDLLYNQTSAAVEDRRRALLDRLKTS